jgi:hypothetical protein
MQNGTRTELIREIRGKLLPFPKKLRALCETFVPSVFSGLRLNGTLRVA